MPISYITAASLDGTQNGSAPIYGARAWVNFNGTGTVAIRASGNVSSITDNGTGDYTVNFTTAMSDANYNVVCSGSNSGTYGGTLYVNATTTPSTTAVRVGGVAFGVSGTASIDNAYSSISIFR